MTDNYKKEIARLFNYDIENNESWDRFQVYHQVYIGQHTIILWFLFRI